MCHAYYNENDAEKAAWLRELIKANVIAPGEVDERSITDVQPEDLRGFRQCHFFAGIGGWSYALRIAGWPDDRPAWTGSCPCPSFSAAGKGQGFDDPSHLWPYWIPLIRKCRPATVLGEQVASAIGHGWLDLVYVDLEAAAYSVGAAVLGACSVGAPHIRQRLWFVAHSSFQPEREPAKTFDPIPTIRKARIISRGNGECVANPDSQSPFWSSISRQECNPWSSEPCVGRVVDGVSHKVVEPYLRGFGDAIVPQVAAEFIKASWEAVSRGDI